MDREIRASTARLIEVLGELDEITAANIGRSQRIRARIRSLLTRLEAGENLPDIVETEPDAMIPVLITKNIGTLHDVGATLRRVEAAALRAHGYTMEAIAELFGVSRQRVSILLKNEN